LPLRQGRIAETLAEAIRLANSEPKGPVHLDLAEDVALAPTDEPVPVLAAPTGLAAAPDAAITRAAALIAAAQRPVAVLGSSAMRLRDPELLRKFIERHHLPFATTTMAKGMIDEDHPLSIGCIERSCRQIQRRFLHTADLILDWATIRSRSNTKPGSATRRFCKSISSRPMSRLRCGCCHQAIGDLDASLTRLLAAPAAAMPGARKRSPSIVAPSRPRCARRARRSPPMPPSTRCAARCRATAC